MIHVYTRQNYRNKYWCHATINGMDHSFEGTIEECQRGMQDYLTKSGISESSVLWHKPMKYEAQEIVSVPTIGYSRWRIDRF